MKPIELLVQVPLELEFTPFSYSDEDEERQDPELRRLLSENDIKSEEEEKEPEYTRMIFSRICGLEELEDGCVIWRDEMAFRTRTSYDEVKKMLGW